MKKSFSLGLGCGIILVTVVFYVVYNFQYRRADADTPPITDAEVMERAAKLGMIPFSDLPDAGQLSSVSDQEIIDRAHVLGMVFAAQQDEQTEETEEETEEKDAGVKYIEVSIPLGAVASDVSSILESSGVVEDAEEFLAFLREKGQTTRLQHGSFSLPENGAYEDLLIILQKTTRVP